MTLDPGSTALVLIEYQNEFTSEGGALHGAVAEVMKATDMLANSVKVLEAARKKGVAVMHAPITFAAGYGELTRHPNTWGAAIVDAMAPKEGDIVIEGKRGLDAFASTNLDFILRSKGIKTVLLGGFLTNCCVESTMRTAYEHGFEVITLTDCVAGTSIAEHENAIKYDYPMFSKPMRSADILSKLA